MDDVDDDEWRESDFLQARVSLCSILLFFCMMCSVPGWQPAVNKENCTL